MTQCPYGREDCALADTGTSYWCAACLLVGFREPADDDDDEQLDDD